MSKSFVDEIVDSVYADVEFDSAVMKAAVEKRKEKLAERAAEKAVVYLDSFGTLLRQTVLNLRNIRRMEQQAKELVDAVDTAFRYFAKTGNPIPVWVATKDERAIQQYAREMGIEIPLDSPLRKV